MFLCSLPVPSGFGGRAECELIMAHISQGVLAAWWEGRAGNEGVRNRALCELELLQCSGANIPLLQAGEGPSALEQKPRGCFWAGLIPSKCVVSFLPAKPHLPNRGVVLKKVELEYTPSVGQRPLWDSLSIPIRARHSFPSTSFTSASNGHPHCLQMQGRVKASSIPWTALSSTAAVFVFQGATPELEGPALAPDVGRGVCWSSCRKPDWALGSSNLLLLPCSWE